MSISFPFKEEESSIFGKIKRPIAEFQFQTRKTKIWQSVEMIIDTGADYTLLPKFLAEQLEISLKKDTNTVKTRGVGGVEQVFLLKQPIKVKIGTLERSAILGFINNDFIPPLAGRHTFLETFDILFSKFTTTFS